jgi:hypothetical protein
MKTDSLHTPKTTQEPISTAEAEIFQTQSTAQSKIIDENLVAAN